MNTKLLSPAGSTMKLIRLTILLFAVICTSFLTPLSTLKVNAEENDSLKISAYSDEKYSLSFEYAAASWSLSEESLLPVVEHAVKKRIRLTPVSGQPMEISIYHNGKKSLFDWLVDSEVYASDFLTYFDSTSRSSGIVNGALTYVWTVPSSKHDVASRQIAIEGKDYVYVMGFALETLDLHEVNPVINSISVGETGATRLPEEWSSPNNSEIIVSGPTRDCCTEHDSGTNPYGCCSENGVQVGNCTWKAEEQRSGSNNFSFGVSGGRDAYRWMSLAGSSNFQTGGTYPQVGATMVFRYKFGNIGHVSTISRVTASDVYVTEQNCISTGNCTQTNKKYSFSSKIIPYLAGYIYKGSSAPTPASQTISDSLNATTVVDDFYPGASGVGFSFFTHGPGCKMGINTKTSNGVDERSWGVSDEGRGNLNFMHYICAKSGTSENHGRWRLYFTRTGIYEIQAWIPNSAKSAATALKYEVNGALSSAINQKTSKGTWVKIQNPGRADRNWSISSGHRYVVVKDTFNGTAGQLIAFDDIRVIRR
jgi:hypothetical protein